METHGLLLLLLFSPASIKYVLSTWMTSALLKWILSELASGKEDSFQLQMPKALVQCSNEVNGGLPIDLNWRLYFGQRSAYIQIVVNKTAWLATQQTSARTHTYTYTHTLA